ncbi:MAG: hypothetical protein QOE82_3721, partial [Thermoanaerobaculia bacterium]|nr:hypothetical protein [Thermoanaerobaculia bacterium]
MLAGRVVRVLVATLFVVTLPMAAAPRRAKIPVTIGLVIFNKDPEAKKRDVAQKTNEEIVTEYLDAVGAKAEKEPGPEVHFDIVRGNYYQVLHWMRTGAIDGAVLSPFSYELLQEDAARLHTPPDKQPRGVVTFPTAGRRSAEDGNEPLFSAYTNGQPEKDAEAALQRCLNPTSNCQFQFISHLSTTGFFYPAYRLSFFGSGPHLTIDQLMQRSRFVLWHGTDDPLPSGTVLRFSYASSKYKKPEWHPLLPDQRTFAPDVLTINCGTTHLAGRCDDVVRLLQGSASTTVPPVNAAQTTSRYTVPVIFEREPFDVFAEEVKQLRNGPFQTREQKWDDWYTNENYEFSTSEIVDLLRNDQFLDHRRQASVVLPGGGVRGAYQAAMLDHLYNTSLLNVLSNSKDMAANKPSNRFLVSSV